MKKIILALSLISFLAGQARANEPIKLIHADSLVGSQSDAGAIRDFFGSVRLRQGDVIVDCDRAKHFLSENFVKLEGNVVITQNDLRLTAPYADYDGNTGLARAENGIVITDKNVRLEAERGEYSTRTKIAEARREVRISEDSTTIYCDRIEYRRVELITFAYGDVLIDDDSAYVLADMVERRKKSGDNFAYGDVYVKGKFDNTYLLADTIESIGAENYTLAYGSPILFQIDSTAKIGVLDSLKIDASETSNTFQYFEYDTLSISSNTMEAFRGAGRETYKFSGDVEIYKGNIAAAADRAMFYNALGKFELFEKPIVWYDSTQLSGDTIIVKTSNNNLQYVFAISEALAVSKTDSLNPDRKDQIAGDWIKLNFDGDALSELIGGGGAASLYFLSSEKGSEGAARNGADTIIVNFDKNEAREVIWLGGVEGEFYPEKMIFGDVKEFYLPKFKWSDAKPQKKFLKTRSVVGKNRQIPKN